MPRYLYKAKKGPNELTEGFVDADSEAQALSKIGSLGLFPISIRTEGDAVEGAEGSAPSVFLKKIRAADLAIFTRQLADLLGSGMTVVNSLDILAKQTENKRLKKVIAEIRDYIKSGNTVTAALRRFPSMFTPLYVNMVNSGEISGALENVLNRLADFLEEQEEFRTKVQAALAYPVLLATLGFIVVSVLLTFVVPRVVGIFEDLGQELPLVTSLLLAVSKFIRGYWYIAGALIALLVFFVRQINRTPEGKSALDKIKAGLPLVGPLLKKTDIARFSRTFATLLKNGVAILHSIEIVEGIMSSEEAKRELKAAFLRVRDGAPLAKALSEGRYFPLFVTNMIAVGEESGQLEAALFKIADSYERESDKAIKIISSLIEPVMILVMGVMVGFIVLSILLPIFQISLIVR
ncbi:MAG: type II secretion system F family protein [Candidatus Omnitrophica bacterium]|nr:type II secretion system F family protein [Candidatus Omnitrophota bacterium]